jgi:hypothetical protein
VIFAGAAAGNEDRMKETHIDGDLDGRVAESVRRALRLAGQPENGVERAMIEEPEETEVS